MVDKGSIKLKIHDSEMVETIPIELIQKGIIITNQEEKENKIIYLEVIIFFNKETEGLMLSGKKIKITAKGLEGGLRNSSDGIVFFGKSEKKDVFI